MLGYWLGAMITGVASGLVIVFALQSTAAEHTTRHTVSPIVQLVFAGLLLLAAAALAKGGGRRVRQRLNQRHKKEDKQAAQVGAAFWRTGQPLAHVRGRDPAVISRRLPTWAALDRLIHLHYAVVVTVLIVIGFCLVQNLLLEIPMLAFKIWPRETPAAIDSTKAWGARHGRQYGAWALAILGVALAIISLIGLLSR